MEDRICCSWWCAHLYWKWDISGNSLMMVNKCGHHLPDGNFHSQVLWQCHCPGSSKWLRQGITFRMSSSIHFPLTVEQCNWWKFHHSTIAFFRAMTLLVKLWPWQNSPAVVQQLVKHWQILNCIVLFSYQRKVHMPRFELIFLLNEV